MNNKRRLIVSVLTLLVVGVIGYALFSETITINGTVGAKGDFNMEIVGIEPGYPQKYLDYIAKSNGIDPGTLNKNSDQAGYVDGDYGFTEKSAHFETTLLYPSAKRLYTIVVENKGTTPGYINNVMQNGKYCEDTNHNNLFETDECIEGSNPNESPLFNINYWGMVVSGEEICAEVDGIIYDLGGTNDDNREYMKTHQMHVNDKWFYLIKPGEKMYYLSGTYFNENFGYEGLNSISYKASLENKFNFVQYNE